MRIAELKNSNNEVLGLPIPDHPKEVKLMQYINLSKELEKWGNWQDSHKDVSEYHWNQAEKRHWASALDEFFMQPVSKFLKVGFKKDVDLKSQKQTLTKLYGHVLAIVSEYKPKLRHEGQHTFQHKGEVFYIPTVYLDMITKQEAFAEATVQEYIEGMEVLRMLKEGTGWVNDTDKDPDGSRVFTSYLQLLAILCRKEGEKLPTDESPKDKFISERIQFFQDIDMVSGLDTAFFLASTLRTSATVTGITGFLTLLYGHRPALV